VENQAKSFCLTENARRASLIALIFAPLLVLVSGALRNQQADNLLPAFFSTDSLSWFYWDQSRYGSIHSFLASAFSLLLSWLLSCLRFKKLVMHLYMALTRTQLQFRSRFLHFQLIMENQNADSLF
jgi:hypothetical protein